MNYRHWLNESGSWRNGKLKNHDAEVPYGGLAGMCHFWRDSFISLATIGANTQYRFQRGRTVSVWEELLIDVFAQVQPCCVHQG